MFGLSTFERSVLVVTLAAEIDLKYERLFSYLQDDVTKKRPTVDLALRLLCSTLSEQLAARQAFAMDAPLLRWELIALGDDPGVRHPVLRSRYLKLDERIAAYLLGDDALDPRLASLAIPVPVDGHLNTGVCERLMHWSRRWTEAGGIPVGTEPLVLFHGSYGTGRRAAAAFLAKSLGRPCLLLDLARHSGDVAELRHTLRLAEREALLTGALLCFYQVDRFLQRDPTSEQEQDAFVHALAHGRAPTALLGERTWEPARLVDRRPFLRMEMPETTYGERRERWADCLAGTVAALGDRELSALAGRFQLTAGQIEDALLRARTLAWARDPLHGQMTPEDVDAACRTQSQHRLDTLARKLTPRYSWSDIVLRSQELSTLRLITAMIRQRAVVYGEWGFDRKLAMGKGVMALFAGPSGTGKTMAAEIIAGDLGLDLYKIDLSAVVNKYVGETEKNLERMFTEAKSSDADPVLR